ncbi:MAG: hypothetical protein WAV50_02320 [Minisyncoccia bacterium]
MLILFGDGRRRTRELFVPCLADQEPGHLVFPRGDGPGLLDCLSCFNRGHFGVAIINNNVAHPNGVELLNLIRASDEFSSLPVVIYGDDCIRDTVAILKGEFISTRHRATVLDQILESLARLQSGCLS